MLLSLIHICLVEAAKLLVSNKYYLMICVTYILQQIYGAMISMGTYYTAHIQMCIRDRCRTQRSAWNNR